VSAYGIIMYANFVFVAIFIGYSIGSAPIVGYNYGAGNKKEMKNVLKKSLVTVAGFGILMAATAWLLSDVLALIFVPNDESLYELTVHGFNVYAYSFLVCGMNIFASSFFTALSNGFISALISAFRIFVQVIMVLLLPIFWQVEGIWYSIVVAEVLSALFAVWCLYFKRKRYGYFASRCEVL
ncbi:MAG: MATE family efflux transporter, partial [Clostridia bacterium]|nr:MATE family efflux transporter [Clostridia bacterium]